MGGRERDPLAQRPSRRYTDTHTHTHTHTHGDRTVRERDRHLMAPQQGGGRATKADTQTDGQMGRRQSPESPGYALREAQVWQWVVRAPVREGWGEWDGQMDRASSPLQIPHHHSTLHLHCSISVFLSLQVSLCLPLCKPELSKDPERKMGKEDRDGRKRRGTLCVSVCVCVQHKVCLDF